MTDTPEADDPLAVHDEHLTAVAHDDAELAAEALALADAARADAIVEEAKRIREGQADVQRAEDKRQRAEGRRWRVVVLLLLVLGVVVPAANILLVRSYHHTSTSIQRGVTAEQQTLTILQNALNPNSAQSKQQLASSVAINQALFLGPIVKCVDEHIDFVTHGTPEDPVCARLIAAARTSP